MVRRTIAVGGGVLVVILLVLLSGPASTRARTARSSDYANSSAALVQRVERRRATALFALLQGSGGAEPGRGRAEHSERLPRAVGVDRGPRARPGRARRASTAQRYLLDTLEFRRDGLAKIADRPARRAGRRIPSSGIRGRGPADAGLPRQRRDLRRALQARPREGAGRRGRVRGHASPASAFIPDIEWLQPTSVADAISRRAHRAAAASDADSGGLHGNGLVGVTLSAAWRWRPAARRPCRWPRT